VAESGIYCLSKLWQARDLMDASTIDNYGASAPTPFDNLDTQRQCLILTGLHKRDENLSMALTLQLFGSDEPSELVNGVRVKRSVVDVLASGIWNGSIDLDILSSVFHAKETGAPDYSEFKLPKEAVIGALDRVAEQLAAPIWDDIKEPLTAARRREIEERSAEVSNALALAKGARLGGVSDSVATPAAVSPRKVGFPTA
jgi:hypothetical protein